MTPHLGRPFRQRLTGQVMIPVTVLSLLALVAGLTLHARVAERSHQKTAAQAQRDYAAFAAWEFERQTESRVYATIASSLLDVQRITSDTAATLPSPRGLHRLLESYRCQCGLNDVRFVFRVDLPSGRVQAEGTVEPGTQALLEKRLPGLAGAANQLDRRQGHVRLPGRDLNQMIGFTVDTLNGVEHLLMYTVVRNPDDRAVAVYGIAMDPQRLRQVFTYVMEEARLLPPSLVGGAPNDSVVRVQVTRKDGAVLFTSAGPAGSGHAASETLSHVGGPVVTVELSPATAAALIVGDVPRTNFPVLVALVAGAVLLAAGSLVQLRRGRDLARARSRFVANVSHELRTPLAQISLFSETLSLGRERSPEERQHFLSVIFREARRLTHLVESALRFSRGEVDDAHLRVEPRAIAHDVQETIASFQPLAAASDTEFRLELQQDVRALADAGAVRQIVLNLLDNAVKYGPRGQTITVTLTRRGGEVIVSIADQGPGIASSDRMRVFEPFTRLDRLGAPRTTGTGIGLAVVRELVTTLGGRVWIDDPEPAGGNGSVGARISFTLIAVPSESDVGDLRMSDIGGEGHTAPDSYAGSGVPQHAVR